MKKKINLLLVLLAFAVAAVTAKPVGDVTMAVNGMKTTMNNGRLYVTIGTNGQVSSMKVNGTRELLASGGVYFDKTTAQGNSGLNPSKLTVVKNTPEMCEVRYTSNSGNTLFEVGYIMRNDIGGLYVYVVATGTATSGDEPIKEARVCSRVESVLLNGYVDWRMNGKIPSNAEMEVAEKEENTIQDATYRLADGSIYTKYNWANYVERDTLHGLSNGYYGLFNIPVSYEWINGGVERQELTVHATSKSPITIQMLQGEHLGGSAMVLDEGEKRLYGPFLIYTPYAVNPLADAQAAAAKVKAQWPFQWFDHELYPKARGTVKGHLNVTTGQRNDNVRVILAQEKGKDPLTHTHGYQFWAKTDENGDFCIENVRPGNYNLYAYATAGDVTDMLEQDDITVVEGEQNLGTINWTPTCYTDQLWIIGENDRRSSEFNLCDEMRQYGLWEQSPAALTYTVGQSDPKKDWYYAQTKAGTWTVKFNLDRAYTGTACLTASLAGATNAGATVNVKVNGVSCATWKPGVNDAAIYRSAIQSGRHWLMSATFPAARLRLGSNTVTFTMSGNGKNGGFMYDCIKLETGSLVTSVRGVSDAMEQPAFPSAVKYVKDGRVVIENANGTYTVSGAQMR